MVEHVPEFHKNLNGHFHQVLISCHLWSDSNQRFTCCVNISREITKLRYPLYNTR
ncbi:hypothetical protein J6590_071939 [Homalodisca vitripennis]|nr:hypothetical protein J6590_071939 [Homalodisca vitripennis]